MLFSYTHICMCNSALSWLDQTCSANLKDPGPNVEANGRYQMSHTVSPGRVYPGVQGRPGTAAGAVTRANVVQSSCNSFLPGQERLLLGHSGYPLVLHQILLVHHAPEVLY